MAQLYIPRKKVIIASSFEGVVNNGAKECGVVSLSAYDKMLQNGQISEQRGLGAVKPETVMGAFILLRPLVAVAEDYLTVLKIIEKYPATARAASHGKRNARYVKEDIELFKHEFERIKNGTSPEQAAIFKKEFYAERKSRQDSDYKAWLNLQEPFSETIGQLRLINPLKTFDSATFRQTAGFKLYYVTSKDEASTYQLCAVYGETGGPLEGMVRDTVLSPGENWPAFLESMRSCIISRECIIGKETVESVDKLEQMKIVAEKEKVGPSQVWRVQDRNDEEEINALNAAGFTNQFIVTGGYAFPSDYEKAREAGVPVLERSQMARRLSEFANENGF